MGKNVSLGDVAAKAGVSRMTASLALRNQPGRVSQKVKNKVVSAAKSLGYLPDAHINAWMTQVRGSKSKALIPIAWLNADDGENSWHRKKELTPYFEGARKRCEELGYQLLDDFWLHGPGMTGARMSQIIYSRGIRGVIVTPFNMIFRISGFNWNNFASVSFEKSLVAPRLHHSARDHHYNTLLALKSLRRMGYRRIGIFLSIWSDMRSYHACHAASIYFYQNLPADEQVPILIHKEPDSPGPGFGKWLRESKPEVIVGHNSKLPLWLKAEGYSVPNDIGVVHMGLEDDCADWAGIWAGKREIGAAAAELVIEQLRNNSFGVPRVGYNVMIRGRWHPGWTLRDNRPGQNTAQQKTPVKLVAKRKQ